MQFIGKFIEFSFLGCNTGSIYYIYIDLQLPCDFEDSGVPNSSSFSRFNYESSLAPLIAPSISPGSSNSSLFAGCNATNRRVEWEISYPSSHNHGSVENGVYLQLLVSFDETGDFPVP